MRRTLAGTSWVLVAACLPDISGSLDPGPPPDPDDTDVVVVTTPTVPADTADTGPDEPPPLPVAEITVDATDPGRWVGLDLDAFDPGADPDGEAWDLRFRRFEVAVSGGVSGAGGVEVARLEGVPFEDALAVPSDAVWATDLPDADGDGVLEYVFVDWYDYDQATHLLSPADRTYAVRTTEGAVYRLRFESYYDDAGTPARIRLRTGPLAPTDP